MKLSLLKGKYKEHQRLMENIFSLSLLQGANYILPLLTVPYLVRVLGPGKYGLINFAQAFVQYFIMLTDYGFVLSGPREISINRNNFKKMNECFNSIMFIKTAFMLISFIILIATIYIFPKFTMDYQVYLAAFLLVIGNALFPLWFFQGIEQMKYISFFNISSKIISTLLIFVFVRTQADYIYVIIINSISSILIGILAIQLIFRKFSIQFRIPPKEVLYKEIKQGWILFLSMNAVNIQAASNTFILGLFSTPVVVGYYTAAETVVRAVTGVFQPISQAVYPHISKLMIQSKEVAIHFIKKVLLIIGLVTLIASICLFLLAGPLVHFALGDKFLSSIIVIRILSFLPFITGVSGVLGVQTMLNLNMNKAFSNILIIASVLNILLALLFVFKFAEIGIASSRMIADVFITLSMYYYLKRKGINLLKNERI